MENSYMVLLSQVLPKEGYYAAVKISSNSFKPVQKVFSKLQDFKAFIQECNDEKSNCFFGLSSFEKSWHQNKNGKNVFRTQENAKRQKSLWLDIDIGETKNYPTLEDAVNSVKVFSDTLHFPHPTLVCSGEGLHVYFPFQTEVSTLEWRPLADRFSLACKQHGLKYDPARTKDPASILRMPDSLNFKKITPTKVFIISLGEEIDIDFLKSSLPCVETTPSPQSLNFIGNADKIIQGCLQLQNLKTANEPLWRGALSILRLCENGRNISHQLSSLHESYTFNDTEEKLNQLELKNIGAYTCKTFYEHKPELCLKCPHFNQIKSPLSLSLKSISSLAIPYFNSKQYKIDEYGCYIYLTKEIDKHMSTYAFRFHRYPIYPMEMISDCPMGEDPTTYYIWRFHNHMGYKDVQIEGAVLFGNNTGLQALLGKLGVALPKEATLYMEKFMRMYLSTVQEQITQSNLQHHLGWSDDKESFFLGNKIYRKNSIVTVNPRGKAMFVSNQTVPHGDLKSWIDAANLYKRENQEWAQVIICAGFASPLMKLGSLEKATTLSIVGEKGHGKSTVQMIATAIYGNPEKLMITKADTPNAKIEKLGLLHSISAMFDEMTHLAPSEASSLIYQITQGQGKARLKSGGACLMDNTTAWSTMPVMSSNTSLIDILSQHGADSSPEMSRIIELHSSDISKGISTEEFLVERRITRKIKDNYGHAGDIFIKFLMDNKETVEDLILDYEDKFTLKTGFINEDRFWAYAVVRIMTAGTIAYSLGLITFDMKHLEYYLITQIVHMKHSVKRLVHDINSWLADFLSEHIDNKLEVKTEKRSRFDAMYGFSDDLSIGALNDINYVLKEPKSKIMIRYVLEDKIYTISKKALKDWCTKNRYNFMLLITTLKENGFLIPPVSISKDDRMDLGKGTRYRGQGFLSVIRVKMLS